MKLLLWMVVLAGDIFATNYFSSLSGSLFASCYGTEGSLSLPQDPFNSPIKEPARVLVCGIDGLHVGVLKQILTENLEELEDFKKEIWDKSVKTLSAKVNFPSESVTGWNAIFYGRKPSALEMLFSCKTNPRKYNGQDNLFNVISENYSRRYNHPYKAAIFGRNSWDVLEQIIPAVKDETQHFDFKSPNTFGWWDDIKSLTRDSAVMFFYFGETDAIGHQEGLSQNYKSAVIESFKLIYNLKKELLGENDYLCIVSDHGRDDIKGCCECCASCICLPGMTHRAFWRESTKNVPLLFQGPGINTRVNIDGCNVADVTPTLLSLLGISPTKHMSGNILKISQNMK